MPSLRTSRSVAVLGDDGVISVDVKIPDSVDDLNAVELEEGEEVGLQGGASGGAPRVQQGTTKDKMIHVLHVTFHRCDVVLPKNCTRFSINYSLLVLLS